MDLFSRKIIAWNVGYNMKQELVLETLNNAFKNRKSPINVIIHSDKGSQMRSFKYRDFLKKHNLVFSYTSLNHSCDENAFQESFHSLLKKEWLYQKNLYTFEDAYREIYNYIEGFYNPFRIHSSNGYISPIEFENIHSSY